MNDEEYRGPAVLTIGDERHPVRIRMSARFEPLEGRFRWAGRTSADPALAQCVGREARLHIERTSGVRLSEPDPWGGVRLSGTGTPPWFR
ncbi:DUF4873 domain-containing protein [Paractinoplanes abujensis]|uniref:DUF4873 domain-containing protein n=1 Tax=Paractinoplanes abujensis TaxID=882441 RepID=A0A7W7FZC9_9ACTN|nr:DUF4873 domain-containing protein [Actinoplanes abujensis]MBB4691928.1 hypothetical protein [Actinoplanes abujensis]GID16653.1 DUF4873 domain-containing protein [Actinoplanes abujensis]